jgi:hypothetical protein
VVATLLCHRVKATVYNTHINEDGHIPVTLYIQKQVLGHRLKFTDPFSALAERAAKEQQVK